MFRNALFTGLMGLGTLGGLTAAPTIADAHPPIERIHHRFEIRVLRHGCWERYGEYCERWEAERVAHHLRREGRAVEIRSW